MTRTTAKPWSTQAAGPEAKASLSCQVGPPWISKTVGKGPSPAGFCTRAWIRPPGPSTQASWTGTDGGAFAPGGSRTTAPLVDRTTGGRSAEDHRYSTVPSGRAVAPDTVPAGVSTRTGSGAPGSYRHSSLRASKLCSTSSAEPSGYHSAPTSPGRSTGSAVSVPATGSQIIGSQRPRR